MFAKLRVETMKRIDHIVRRLSARWDIIAEDAFGESLKGLLEKNFRVKISK